jgi:hypothetical protein
LNLLKDFLPPGLFQLLGHLFQPPLQGDGSELKLLERLDSEHLGDRRGKAVEVRFFDPLE